MQQRIFDWWPWTTVQLSAVSSAISLTDVIRTGSSRGGKGEVFPGPATFGGGAAIAQKYWKWSSRRFFSDLKYAKNPFLAGADPLGKLTAFPQTLNRWWGDTPPRVSSLSTPSASRSRRIRNEVVIGPRDNGLGPRCGWLTTGLDSDPE